MPLALCTDNEQLPQTRTFACRHGRFDGIEDTDPNRVSSRHLPVCVCERYQLRNTADGRALSKAVTPVAIALITNISQRLQPA